MEEALAANDARQLMALGFPLPLSTGDCAASPAPARFASLDPTATGVPLVLEVFAGSARITQCCRQAGLRADAIDHKPHALSKVEPLLLDLTTPEGRRVLRSALAHPDLKAVWWAPPRHRLLRLPGRLSLVVVRPLPPQVQLGADLT